MTQRLNKGIAFEAWPPEDKRLWGRAFEGTDIFESPATSLSSSSTKYGRRGAYSVFLGFIELIHPDLLNAPPAARVTQMVVADYLEYLSQNCRETTAADCLARLYYVIRALCPEGDWRWLYQASRKLARKAMPIRHPQVLSSDLYLVGISMMDRALKKASAKGRLTKSCAIRFRDGLIIATLVEVPIRRRAFSSLIVGEHVIYRGSRWCIRIPAELNKTGRPLDFDLSERLSRCMNLFVEQIRPMFPGASDYQSLWPYEGRPMTDKMIRRRTIKWTRLALGVGVTPHRFRNAAANFISAANPEGILVARDLLGHRSFAMTEKHYLDGAQSRAAGVELSRIIEGQTATGERSI